MKVSEDGKRSADSAELIVGGKRPEVPSVADLALRLAKEIAGGQQNNDSLSKSDNAQNAPSDLPIFYAPIPSDKFKCCACGEVLRRPVKFEVCGHSCCSTCYSDIVS